MMAASVRNKLQSIKYDKCEAQILQYLWLKFLNI